ncbi:uncharacterized protein BDR25DRAFT_362468 [Lindgomyces ingoldianus]|uniref:Uncharacterized protein n=1 Tax=Lindgomyces ingoldianus TaxID=673940 RepID=A0ACB6QB28_9PLEO|nr:uncharacterized protein BDR25DRAFT_362468 [Lindgomyces ingoldianus]KAF2463793.1 hypothetical protein BDR25DRAFT_362468 [Lindgomyces ingoldianus]
MQTMKGEEFISEFFCAGSRIEVSRESIVKNAARFGPNLIASKNSGRSSSNFDHRPADFFSQSRKKEFHKTFKSSGTSSYGSAKEVEKVEETEPSSPSRRLDEYSEAVLAMVPISWRNGGLQHQHRYQIRASWGDHGETDIWVAITKMVVNSVKYPYDLNGLTSFGNMYIMGWG